MHAVDEVRDWSQDESGGDQSDVEESLVKRLKTAVAAGDGSNSGDLGDESHAYFTEEKDIKRSAIKVSSDTPRNFLLPEHNYHEY